MNAQDNPPVIIIKKKSGHGGHHGGAWKVAYADFVTAMMALFIVLWLMNSSEKIRKAISAYFQDPSGSGKMSGSASTGTGESVSVNKDNMANLKDQLEQALKRSPEFSKLKDYVQMSVTGEGLRVELLESEKGMFFESGNPVPTGAGRELLLSLAEQLRSLPNDVMIEGHTDSKPLGGRADYTNWELSADRANAARRILESAGLRPGQIVQIRGFADRSPRDADHPEAAFNRRVSVIIRYQSAPSGSGKEPEDAGPPKPTEEAKSAEPAKSGEPPGQKK